MYILANKIFKALWRFHQSDGYMLSMGYMIIGFSVYMLVGCSTIQYIENGAEFSRSSFGTMTRISEFTVNRDQSGHTHSA
jgi:nitrate/nitrite transporter NarK